MSETSSEYDFLVVGSGASGATAAVVLAEAGRRVAVIEEGHWYRKPDFAEDLFTAIHQLFRDYGMQMAKGRSVLPVLEGRCVGGSTVMNGAIIHRLDETIYQEWTRRIPGLGEAIPFSLLEESATAIESDLGIKRNWGSILPSLPISRSLKKLGWEHQAMLRNAPGCRGSARCLQGCPTGGKWSMETSYVPRAVRAGAEVLSDTRVERILFDAGHTAVGVQCRTADGKRLTLQARRGVLIATGVVQTPLLLARSGLGANRLPHLGQHFQTHLGVGIVGLMDRPAVELEGPPQGIEITGFKAEGYKLATQTVPLELLLSRTPFAGQRLVEELKQGARYSSWMASIRSEAEGTIGRSLGGKAKIRLEPTSRDLEKVRGALHRLSQLLFEMGASKVYPGISGPEGLPVELTRPEEAEQILRIPLDARNFWLSAGHLFGTARLGTDRSDSVVGTDFRVHTTQRLYVVDGSVFPTNLGVNPQHSIMALARVAASQIASGV